MQYLYLLMFITGEKHCICIPNEDHTYVTSSTATTGTQAEPVDATVQTEVSKITNTLWNFSVILRTPRTVSKPVNVKQ